VRLDYPKNAVRVKFEIDTGPFPLEGARTADIGKGH
jgi:hypothetical protein